MECRIVVIQFNLAEFNYKDASVKSYGYNISVIVKRKKQSYLI